MILQMNGQTLKILFALQRGFNFFPQINFCGFIFFPQIYYYTTRGFYLFSTSCCGFLSQGNFSTTQAQISQEIVVFLPPKIFPLSNLKMSKRI